MLHKNTHGEHFKEKISQCICLAYYNKYKAQIGHGPTGVINCLPCVDIFLPLI